MKMKLMKKITIKGMCGDVKKLVNAHMKDGEIADGIVIKLVRIVGKCNRFEVKSNDLGDSVCLKGQFQATNLITGESARGGTCYMPDVAAEAVAGMLQDDVESVEFGFDISLLSDSTSIVGYVYDVLPLIQPQEDDALNRLADSLPSIPALEAPKEKAKAKAA